MSSSLRGQQTGHAVSFQTAARASPTRGETHGAARPGQPGPRFPTRSSVDLLSVTDAQRVAGVWCACVARSPRRPGEWCSVRASSSCASPPRRSARRLESVHLDLVLLHELVLRQERRHIFALVALQLDDLCGKRAGSRSVHRRNGVACSWLL